MLFIKTPHCKSKVHCKACREDANFRQSIAKTFEVPPDFDFRCALESKPPEPPKPKLPKPVIPPPPKPEPQVMLVVNAPPKPSGPLVTATVTGFTGNNPPNGTWSMQAPNTEGVVGGVFLAKLLPADQGWNLEIYRRCCGGRLKLYATGKATGLGSTFDVIGDGEFKGQKGIGSVV
jgi:hypothetical protein